jgi:hypothetical protein
MKSLRRDISRVRASINSRRLLPPAKILRDHHNRPPRRDTPDTGARSCPLVSPPHRQKYCAARRQPQCAKSPTISLRVLRAYAPPKAGLPSGAIGNQPSASPHTRAPVTRFPRRTSRPRHTHRSYTSPHPARQMICSRRIMSAPAQANSTLPPSNARRYRLDREFSQLESLEKTPPPPYPSACRRRPSNNGLH